MDERTVADAIVGAWEEADVELAIGMDDPQAVFQALRRSGIRTVIIHDERSGAFLADGYGRASLKPAVCAGISGPGATNLTTGMLEAYAASSPVIALVGESKGTLRSPAFQEVSHDAVLGSFAKAIVRAEADDPAAAARYAAQLAEAGRPRPVLFLADAAGLWEPAGPDAPATSTAVEPPSVRPEAVSDLADLLGGAERPVILAGNGVHVARAYDALQGVAEAFKVPVATTLLGKGAIAETHPLALGVASSYNSGSDGHGKSPNRSLGEADVLVVVGTDLDPIVTSAGLWPSPDTDVVHIDLDVRSGLGRSGKLLCGDAREVLSALLEKAPATAPVRPWVDEQTTVVAEERARLLARDEADDPDGYVSPAALMLAIGGHLDAEDAIVTDASYSSAWALDRIRQAAAGRHVFAPRGSGPLGWGLPAALGVQLARPDRKVACLTGDGGLLFSIAELETAAREQLPVVLFLLNNGCYGFQRHSDLKRQGVDHTDLKIGPIDWGSIAKGVGWDYVSVTPDADLKETVADAFGRGRPTFVDVPVDEFAKPPLLMFDEQEAVAH